jgi:hypothetical protein
MTELNPFRHELNSYGTACEDGTSCAGAIPCPACQWAEENATQTDEEETIG